jgi:hypothetical protein
MFGVVVVELPLLLVLERVKLGMKESLFEVAVPLSTLLGVVLVVRMVVMLGVVGLNGALVEPGLKGPLALY